MAAGTILSCDWGTSNLRLRAVDAASGRVLSEARSNDGIKSTFDSWRASGGDRIDHFFGVLERLIRRSGVAEYDALVISGMAASSIGLLELPYAEIPFALDGSNVVYRVLRRPSIECPVVLVSGVRTASDVMRGEETELIGLWTALNAPASNVTFVLPGTHCKHVAVRDGCIRDFSTYMTGELFEVLARHSVLEKSIEEGPLIASAFDDGIAASRAGSMQRALFSVRAGVVLGRRSPAENFWYLSGLLIGSELNELAVPGVEEVYLCAGSSHRDLYVRALEKVDVMGKSTIISEELVEESVVRGQLATYYRLQKT